MICDYCDEELVLDLLEVWPEERAFMIETCCEQLHEDVTWQLQDGCREPWIRELFEAYGIPCRQIVHDHMDMRLGLDFGLEICTVDLDEAKAFVDDHHAHHQASLGWRWGHGVRNGDDLIGVAMVGRPVARMIDPNTNVEVTRLCVRRDMDPGYTWNACSMLYAAAAREAKRQGYERVITYVLEEEDGTTLKAAGWKRETRTRGGSWSRAARARTDKAPTGPKWRWARQLQPAAQREMFDLP